jgi:nicotinamidase-related amidase
MPTLDTHSSVQIFNRIFLVDKNGNCPQPNTPITHEDVLSGKWRVNPAVVRSLDGLDDGWLNKYLEHYTSALESMGKPPLMIWNPHASLGSQGYALAPVIEEACRFHEYARTSPIEFVPKGGDPLRENYSVFSPTVKTTHDGQYQGRKDQALLDLVLSYDMIITIGEASSHCVADSVSDLLDEIEERDPKMADKLYIVEDCMSPVVIVLGDPNLDFTPVAKKMFDRARSVGAHVVRSTEPMEEWPNSQFALED